MALEVHEENLGAVSYHKVVLEEPVMRRSQPQRHSQIEHRGEELGRRRRAEDLREPHSTEQNGRRAQPTAGEKSIPSSRGESEEQKEQRQLQAETFEENNFSKKEVGPMTRDKDTESHRHIATEHEFKVAETQENTKSRSNEEIEVEEWNAARVEKAIS